MALMVDIAKRSVRYLRRQFFRSEDDSPRDEFPIDAWTQQKEYEKWFEAHRATPRQLAEQRRDALNSGGPLFSFIVPLFKTPPEYLHTMADSVLGQTYPRFELILVNASPESSELAREVGDYVNRDARVKVVALDANYGITENTNRGIEASTGEFCCFLDHDDFLEPNLLFEYAAALEADPEIDVLYCDEDLVVRSGDAFVPTHPLFKPDYSPELLLCTNYIVHLMTVRRSLIDEMPSRDARYDGAQDYNMIQFATLHARKVHHVPKVLYRWRISENSTATNPEAKPYGQKASRRAAYNRASACAPNGRVIESGIVSTHNLWFSGLSDDLVSLVVDCGGSRTSAKLFGELFAQNNSYSRYEIILVVDDSCGQIDCVWFDERTKIVTVPQSLGYFARLNAGARNANGEYLVFLDSGSYFVTPEPLEQLIGLCAINGVGVSAPKLLYADGTNRMYGIAVTSERIMPLYRGYPDDFPAYQCNLRAFQNVSATSTEGMCVRKHLFAHVGGFDESYDSEIGSADFCHSVLESGMRIVQTPTVKLQTAVQCPVPRYDCAVNASDFSADDLSRFDAKWPGVRLAGDPYFNQNLDQGSSYFQVAQ